MDIGKRIKARRKELNLNIDDVAKRLGVAPSTVSRWERGEIGSMKATDASRIADALYITIPELYGTEAEENIVRRIPVVGRVAAGIPIEAIQEIIDWEEIPETMGDPHQYFALEVSGDSMYPYIMDGSRVIIRKQNEAHNGQIAVVMVGKEDATLKQVNISNAGITLTAFNARVYPPHSYTVGEVISLPITIVGVAVEVRMKL